MWTQKIDADREYTQILDEICNRLNVPCQMKRLQIKSNAFRFLTIFFQSGKKLNPLWNETKFYLRPILVIISEFHYLVPTGYRSRRWCDVMWVGEWLNQLGWEQYKEVSQVASCWSIACRVEMWMSSSSRSKCLARKYANDVIILVLPLCIFWLFYMLLLLLGLWYVTVLYIILFMMMAALMSCPFFWYAGI